VGGRGGLTLPEKKLPEPLVTGADRMGLKMETSTEGPNTKETNLVKRSIKKKEMATMNEQGD